MKTETLPTAAAPANRFDGILGTPIFQPASAKSKVYINDDGSKVKRLANVRVPVANTGCYLHAKIEGYVAPNSKTVIAQAKFIGSKTDRGFDAPAGSDAAADLERFLNSLETTFAGWRKAHVNENVDVQTSDVVIDGMEL